MDPLSVIASVAGIATAAGEVIKILRPYTTAAKDAPVIAAEVSSEALATQTIITGLEQLISNFSAANVRYASLIQVDQLTAVLFDGVKIFSELLAVLQTLPPLEPSSPGGSLWTPIQWVRKKSSLTTMLHKLRAFKSSIVCILSILQSDSLARAEESQQQLIAAVDMLLRDNSDLSRRMMGMENIVDTMSHRRATIQSTKDIDAQKGKATSSQRSSLLEFDFEHDLKLSRVYRHAKRDTMDFSARSSVARTHAWSSLSGISLSDISHISVLALPLYVEDISNPQHYNFGQESIQPIPLLAPTTLTRSIYHDCIEVQLQLSQLSWFSQFHQRESSQDENPLSNLISIFRLGIPLLMLFDQLDSSNHERWEHLIASNPSGEVSKLAITEFLKACMKCPTISPSQLVTDTDILLDDTTCHVKVISLVRLLLASLTKAGMIQAIVFESAPNIFAVEPNPASLAVDAFLCDERLYLKRLGILFETVKEIRSFRNLPIDSFDSMFAPIGPLINVQTKFLIKAEILASKPYSQQSWQFPFQEWALHSSTYYATLITGQAETKSMIRAALSLADVRDVERRGALGDFLTILGLPSQQLDKYDAFLKEITQYGFHQPDHIDSAKRSLNLVKEAVNKANITQELNHARAALSKDQDYETNKALWGLGKLLMYDKVDIVDARQEDARQEKVHLYLFQKGIVQAVESFPRDRRRGILGYGKPSPPERLRTRLSVTRIIPAKNLQQVHQVLKLYTRASNVCEIKWIGDETCGCISFAFGSETRITEWIRQVKRVKRQNQLLVPFGNFRGNSKYPLVLLGAGGCGTSDLTIKFVMGESCQEFDPSKYDPYCRMCVIDDGFASIDVIDATGQEDYSAMRQQFIREGAGFMLVYNVTSRRSFEEITTYYHQILKQKDEDHFPVVIVGIDRFQESLREVMTREGESLAEELGCTFVEVDAKSSDEVDGAFFDLVREVRWYRRDLRGY